MLVVRILIILGLFYSGLSAQEPEPAPQERPHAASDIDATPITFEKPSHDFGEVEQADTLETVFQFVNTGYETIIIDKVEADCGCTVPELDKQSYEPGESGTLAVSFDPSQFVGDVEKKVLIRLENKEEFTLKIKAKVIAEIAFEPQRIKLENVSTQNPSSTTVKVKSDTLQKLEITNLKTYPEWLSATLEPQSAQEVWVAVALDPKAFPNGQTILRGYLTFTSNANVQRNIRIPVEAQPQLRFTTTPPSAMFWNVNPSEAPVKEIAIASVSEQAFEIKTCTSSLPFVAVTPGEKTLTISLSEEAPTGRFAGTIQVTVLENDAEFQLSIPVRGKIQEN